MEIYCVRCNKKHRIKDNAVRNAEVYGSNVYACPYCGQAYRLERVIKVNAIPINTEREEDDWGKIIIPF
jgi:DNA-directed RNA polymerase subunit RPC12/RpoP